MPGREFTKVHTLCCAALFIPLALFGCKKASSPPLRSEAKEPVKIGLTAVMTGPNGSAGARYLQGAELAIEEWNARGGVLGRKIEIVRRDDEGKPEKAVMVAQEIISEKVDAVIGPWNSGCALSGSPVFHQNGVPQILMASNAKVTEQGFSRLFRIGIQDDKQAGSIDNLLQKLKLNRIAILHDKTAYGQGVAEKVKLLTEARNAQVVVYDGLNTEELDFRSNLAAIKSSDAQAVFWGGIYNQAGPLYNQMHEQGLDIPLMLPGGSMDPRLIETVGANAPQLYAAFGPPPVDAVAAENFFKKFNARFGPEGSFSLYGYEAANILLIAMERTGSVDSARVSATLHRDSFKTLLGEVRFDAQGDCQGIHSGVWIIRDGRFVPEK